MRPNNLQDKRFGRLLAIRRVENNEHGQARWLCMCDCGKEAVVISAKLSNGHTKSCGCVNRERFKELGKKPKKKYFICAVIGCRNPPAGKYCSMHRGRFDRTGSLEIKRRQNGTGNIGKNGYIDLHIDGRRVYEHVMIAEKALGRSLPKGACVHHVNGSRADNRNTNLVICPNQAYHSLLHKRMRDIAKAKTE